MDTKMANAQEGECEMASMLEDYDFLMPCLKILNFLCATKQNGTVQ